MWLFVSLLCVIYASNILRGESEINTAVQLVYATHNTAGISKYQLNEEALNLILATSRSESFNIISTIGSARKGKSFTEDKIIQKISGSSIMPFTVSAEMDPCTYGIWVYVLPKCPSDSDVSYVTISTEGKQTTFGLFPCTTNDKPYLFLDIEGSDTETEDQAFRYAAIVTLLSSQTFLFLHKKLYLHDIAHVRHIQTFISKMNDEEIDFALDDINLAALIREPMKGNKIKSESDLEKKVNSDFAKYFDKYFSNHDFNKFQTVKEIPHIDDETFDTSIQNIVDYISLDKTARMKWINGEKIAILLKQMVDQLNNNKDLTAMHITGIIGTIVEWEPFIYSECSKKCDRGKQKGIRRCNTGRIKDCKKYVGGSEIEEVSCNEHQCRWIPIGKWGECSKKCGNGKKTRYRHCESGTKDDCIGDEYETVLCNQRECKWIPVGGWTDTGHDFEKIRYRYCETGDNNDCDGNNYEVKTCFSSDSYIIGYPEYEKKSINEVRVHDMVLSFDEILNEYVFSKVILLGHFSANDGGNEYTKMINIEFGNNDNITLTQNHMIYINGILLPASKIQIGDSVHTYSSNKSMIVTSTKFVQSQGRLVVTLNGNIVVNGVAASCYTGNGVFDHTVQHYIVNAFYYGLSVLSPSTITDYDKVMWIRNVVYYGGLKFLLRNIGAIGISSFVLMWCCMVHYSKKIDYSESIK